MNLRSKTCGSPSRRSTAELSASGISICSSAICESLARRGGFSHSCRNARYARRSETCRTCGGSERSVLHGIFLFVLAGIGNLRPIAPGRVSGNPQEEGRVNLGKVPLRVFVHFTELRRNFGAVVEPPYIFCRAGADEICLQNRRWRREGV